LFTIVLSRIFFVEAISPARLAGIAAAFCGIVLLLSRGSASVLASLSFHSGDLLMLSSALSFAVYTLLARKLPGGVRPLSHLAVTSGLGALLLAPFSFWELARGETAHFSIALAGGLLYMGIGASLAAFWCWFRAISHIGPTKASIVYYSLPLFSGFEAVLFLDEPLLWAHFAGGILILGGLALATRNAKK
jgi:drug/metabolite transporter (DMT)-like permease